MFDFWTGFRGLLDAASGVHWEAGQEPATGQPAVAVTFADGRRQELRVTRQQPSDHAIPGA